MKWIKLLTAAHVGGQLRHPHEGVLHLDDAEADRLIEGGVGEDVSADFADAKAAPVETLREDAGSMKPADAPANPHQAEIAPQPAESTTATKPRARKPAASQE